jgi:hypothetical protein
MSTLIRRRPSAATILAIVALVAALTGSAVAGSKFLPSKKFKKLKRTAVTRLTYVNATHTVTPTSGDPGDEFRTVSASCPAGFHPVGGSVKLSPSDQGLWWDDGYLTATGYSSKIANNTPDNRTAVVTVACVAGNATGAPAG